MEQLSRDWLAYVDASQLGLFSRATPPTKPFSLDATTTTYAVDSRASPDDPTPFAERDLGVVPCLPGTGTPDRALEVFQRDGWMPGIAGANQDARLKVLKRFGLAEVGQIAQVDRVAETAKMIFGSKIVTVSCMLEDRGMFITTRGWRPEETDPLVPRMHVGLEASICMHAMSKSEADGCFILPDAQADWRFAQSPYCLPGGPIRFFASANVNLPTLTFDSSVGRIVPAKVPIGSLCIVDPDAREPGSFTERDQQILKNLADTIAREFELGLERKRSAVAKAQTDYLGSLFRSLTVSPTTAPSSAVDDSGIFAHVSANLVELTGASFATIIDLRSFHPPAAPQPPRRGSVPNIPLDTPSTSVESGPPVFPVPAPQTRPPFNRSHSAESSATTHSSLPSMSMSSAHTGQSRTLDSQRAEELLARMSAKGRRGSEGSLAVLDKAVARGQQDELRGWDWEVALGVDEDEAAPVEEDDELSRTRSWRSAERKGRAAEARKAMSVALLEYYRTNRAHYDASTSSPGPLGSILPTGTTSYICQPCFFDGEPTLMLVLGSTTRHFQFEPADRDFAVNVGAVLVGSLLRRRLLEADKAKLHFLSQVSHELRTPLHGVGSYLELIKEVAEPQTLARISPLLGMADVCVTSLREILDSVLSFAKLAHSDATAAVSLQQQSSSHAPNLHLVDLETLIRDVVKSCWTRDRTQRAADGGVEYSIAEASAVDVLLEFGLPQGTQVKVDVGAFKRVLVNLLGNSLKYTDRGSIVIAVSAPSLDVAKDGTLPVLIDIADTGRGMTPAFVKEHLFTPFAQENSFNQGCGLGTSISESLLRNMKGTLRYSSAVGVGTTASINVPLQVVLPSSAEAVAPTAASAFTYPSPGSLAKPLRRNLSQELSALLKPLAFSFSADAVTPLAAPSALPTMPRELGKLVPPAARGVPPLLTPPLTPPVSALPPTSSFASASSPATSAPASVPADFTVLVADDNPIARRVLTAYLASQRIPFVEAEDGAQAVERFAQHRPALLWLDVQMPGKSGLQAAEEIREYEAVNGWRSSRIIAVSGLSASLGKHERALKTGCLDLWITKSGSLQQLKVDLQAHRSFLSSFSALSSIPPSEALLLPSVAA
ncbi:hypothetical protein JCM10207_007941 [Rhodosporidiobolus poonsookiae]